MIVLYQAMIGRLRQLSEPKLRQQTGIEKSNTALERAIFTYEIEFVIFLGVLEKSALPKGLGSSHETLKRTYSSYRWTSLNRR